MTQSLIWEQASLGWCVKLSWPNPVSAPSGIYVTAIFSMTSPDRVITLSKSFLILNVLWVPSMMFRISRIPLHKGSRMSLQTTDQNKQMLITICCDIYMIQ